MKNIIDTITNNVFLVLRKTCRVCFRVFIFDRNKAQGKARSIRCYLRTCVQHYWRRRAKFSLSLHSRQAFKRHTQFSAVWRGKAGPLSGSSEGYSFWNQTKEAARRAQIRFFYSFCYFALASITALPQPPLPTAAADSRNERMWAKAERPKVLGLTQIPRNLPTNILPPFIAVLNPSRRCCVENR